MELKVDFVTRVILPVLVSLSVYKTVREDNSRMRGSGWMGERRRKTREKERKRERECLTGVCQS